MRDICNYDVQSGEGYEISHLVARDNLNLGNSVVADSVNPWQLTRSAWNKVATSNQADFVNIEVVCSDKAQHKKRLETRNVEIANLKPVEWNEILNRAYHPWKEYRLVIDTAGKTISQSVAEMMSALRIFPP